MNMNTSCPVIPGELRGAALSNFTTIAEDGSICFSSDKMHRTCPDCGTVFDGSLCMAAMAGAPACPFCGEHRTAPMPVAGWLS